MKAWWKDMKDITRDNQMSWLIKPLMFVIWTAMILLMTANDALRKPWKS